MKYYAVIDTNVLVSAMLKWNSVPGNVMELAFDGPIIPVYSAEILKEYREVLLRPKFLISFCFRMSFRENLSFLRIFLQKYQNVNRQLFRSF